MTDLRGTQLPETLVEPALHQYETHSSSSCSSLSARNRVSRDTLRAEERELVLAAQLELVELVLVVMAAVVVMIGGGCEAEEDWDWGCSCCFCS